MGLSNLVFEKTAVAKRGLGVVEFGFREIDGGKERLWGCGIWFSGNRRWQREAMGLWNQVFREIGGVKERFWGCGIRLSGNRLRQRAFDGVSDFVPQKRSPQWTSSTFYYSNVS
jgi:hypothetical protein